MTRVRPFVAVVLAILMLAFGGMAQAQQTLEIPEEEFEAVEDYKPIPVPDPSGGPVNQMFETMEMDLTGTLPEAVLESMLGQTPYAFVDVVWGMEVTGNWTDSMTGTGTLQVTNFTEGRGASPQIDREKYSGARGFRMYNARLETEGAHVFTLSAAFPSDSDGLAFGTELDAVKGLFEVTWLCHMFEPGRTGCIDYPDEYYETELPILRKLHVQQQGLDSYRIEFAARVEESRSHRDKGYRSTDLTGRVGEVRGWVCDRDSWENDPQACEAPEPLKRVENSPSHRRENVHLGSPRIEMEFNEPVDPFSLKENFLLATRDAKGDLLEVDGQINQASERLYRFIPDADLESGVIYEARIQGGEEGVESTSGTTLQEETHWWRFSTLVDLENHGEPVDDPVRVHAFQTIRDAPLVMGKPTVQRIYVDWQPHDHIDAGWQPESYPAELDINVLSEGQWEVQPQQGGAVDGSVVRVVRSDTLERDLVKDEIRRQARHTINVFGWRPERQGATTDLEVRLTPHDPWPASIAAPEVLAERQLENWSVDPDPLVMHYAFLKAGAWSEGVPEEVRAMMPQIAREAEIFATQLMPLREISIRPIDLDISPQGEGKDMFKSASKEVRNSPSSGIAPQDIVTLIYDSELVDYAGYNLGSYRDGDPESGLGSALIQHSLVPITHMAASLVHELGHHLGLTHRAGNSDVIVGPPSSRDATIEGFRISEDGLSGWNKSFKEGNGEHLSYLLPLMWPRPRGMEQLFVSDTDYEIMMDALSR
ncbi:Ig-like domain-containing protein [Fodinicurvata sediminis]|uniref:Ig-like domain-containing protein n=1 Tax=Fodinicurvata sediminis TaxID=1121832 RepID=UPI0012DCA626|nr:Ig-like domain-containing protein [Fodinicurvata sediminis]